MRGSRFTASLFSPPKSGIFQAPLLSPSGKVASVCEPIEVKLKYNLMSRLPLGGKLLAKRGDEGQSINRQLVSTSKSGISQASPRFPLRDSLPNCRSKAIPASKVASVCEPIEVRLNFSRCSPPYEKNPTARRRIQLFCPVSFL